MGFTSFKSLPRMLQVLICFFAFGTVLSFFPQLLPKFQGQDGTQPLFNVFWPIIGGGPLSGLIHILILWTLGLDLSKIMTNSLDNQETEALTQYLSSQANGVGINQFTDSLKEMLHDLKISLN